MPSGWRYRRCASRSASGDRRCSRRSNRAVFRSAPPWALELDCGLALMRKPGRLPAATERAHYDLEYGSDSLEIHRDALRPDQRVLVVDDLLATGGTARAAVELVRRLDAEVLGVAVLIELTFLDGRKHLEEIEVHSVLKY